jgi:hypothetical protein
MLMAFVIRLEKRSSRRLDPAVVRRSIQRIADRALAGGRDKKWSLTGGSGRGIEPAETSDGYLYATTFRFSRAGKPVNEDMAQRQFSAVVEIVEKAANGPGWSINDGSEPPAGTNGHHVSTGGATERTGPKDYANVELNTDLGHHFDHIYDRDSQIRLVNSAVRAAIDSNFEHRFNAVLYGPPACGKTEILNTFARMLGEDAVLRFDCTSTTKAGAEKILLESAFLPSILIAEEIEKTSEDSLRYMLGLLDHRAEIRKTNFRIGTQSRKVRMLVLATVNDVGLFERMMDGALASRFSHKVYCPRPTREVLRRILEREVVKPGKDGNPLGKRSWINPALDYALDREGTNDPRRVLTICLSGGDRLLNGSYQKDLDNARDPRLDNKEL